MLNTGNSSSISSDTIPKLQDTVNVTIGVSAIAMPSLEIEGGVLRNTFAFESETFKVNPFFPSCYVARTGESDDSEVSLSFFISDLESTFDTFLSVFNNRFFLSCTKIVRINSLSM